MPKATKRKRKQSSPNSLLVCKKEAVVVLERLSDSAIAEMTTHCPALQPQQVTGENDENSYFDSLPPEVILKIFGYLSQNQLGQIARVCRKWNILSRTSILWRKVSVKFFLPSESQNEAVINFLSMLPTCVIRVNLNFITPFRSFMCENLKFEKICKILQEKCPNLQGLFLRGADLSSLSPLVDLCTLFLPNLVFLALCFCSWKIDNDLPASNVKAPRQCSCSNSDASKIKILVLNNCSIEHFGKTELLKMPRLKYLFVHNTRANDSWFIDATSFLSQLRILDLSMTRITSSSFRKIRKFGRNLEELYLCDTGLRDEDFNFNEQMLPHLKYICLSYCGVTCAGIVSLIQTCQSLEEVYVRVDLVQEFRAHPFVAADRNKSRIVKSLPWNHNHLSLFLRFDANTTVLCNLY